MTVEVKQLKTVISLLTKGKRVSLKPVTSHDSEGDRWRVLLEKVELSSEPMLRDVQTLTQKAPTSVSWPCTRCVVVCENSEVTSVEEGHDVTRHRDDECEMPAAMAKLARKLTSR